MPMDAPSRSAIERDEPTRHLDPCPCPFVPWRKRFASTFARCNRYTVWVR
jgi:hypothetical protein